MAQKGDEELLSCTRCPRLVDHREEMARKKRRAYLDQEYWARPVPLFGDPKARIVIVGLAPAAHGANRTGRMFTGDRSGDFLYAALHRAGIASQPEAVSRDDGLKLKDLAITAAVRCAPPLNKPTREEIENCRPYLTADLKRLKRARVFLCLGKIGHDGLLRHYKDEGHAITLAAFPFGHGAVHELPDGRTIVDSYHVSQQNTFTKRLTETMFDEVVQTAQDIAAR